VLGEAHTAYDSRSLPNLQKGTNMAKGPKAKRRAGRRPSNDGASWSARELKTLRALAKVGTSTTRVAKELGRTAAAVQQKAMRAGISFRAAKRSGARRKK
jgi:hypothetical protein